MFLALMETPMDRPLDRRDFLKAAPATATAIAAAIQHPPLPEQQKSVYPEIGAQPYTPSDYPIRAKRHAEVRVSDRFWKPKIDTNATVTIPFEAQRFGESGRGLSGNVFEAAIYSLETHPDPKLQAQV